MATGNIEIRFSTYLTDHPKAFLSKPAENRLTLVLHAPEVKGRSWEVRSVPVVASEGGCFSPGLVIPTIFLSHFLFYHVLAS